MSKQYKQIGDDLWKNRTEKVNAELFTMTYGALVAQLVQDYEDYSEVNKQLDKMGYNIGTRLIEDFLARTSIPRCADFRETAEVIAKVGFKTFLNINPIITYPTPTTTNPASSSTTSATPHSLPLPSGPTEFILTIEDNPLAEFAELPRDAMGSGSNSSGARAGPSSSGGVTGSGTDGLGRQPDGRFGYARKGLEDGSSGVQGGSGGGVGGREEGLWFSNVLCGVIRGCLEMIQMQTEVTFLSDTLRGDDSTDILVKLVRMMEEELPVNDE